MSRIAVIGAGYVGLVTGVGLARLGHNIVTLEVDPNRLSRILRGQLPIHEPGLEEMVAEERAAGRLEFTDRYAAAIPSADFVFLAVNTPQRPDGEADTSFVFAAMRMVLEHARPGLTVVTKSTVPVGTGDAIEALAYGAGIPLDVASNPEFLREGSAVYDFLHPDRIVVGSDSPEVSARVAALYSGVDAPIILTSRRSAELAKYAANAFLATRISFMNEMASVSDAVGADIGEIERVLGSDSRIGPAFLKAGLGWGGSCFPKDLSALVATASRASQDARIVKAVIKVNSAQRDHAYTLLRDGLTSHADRVVGVLGLAFKPNTDDLRGSPALDVVGRLLDAGIAVQAHDPQAMGQARLLFPSVRYVDDPYGAVVGVDALLLATEWPIYQTLDWAKVRRLMRGRRVVDGRNVLHAGLLQGLGFDYRAFGRGTVESRETHYRPGRLRAVPMGAPAADDSVQFRLPSEAAADAIA